MNANAAMLLCAQQMERFGLKDWQFRWMRSTRTLGMCWYGTKTIGLSRRYVEINTEEHVLDTVLHEIAHAVAGHAANHGPLWQAIAIGIGATPRACAPAAGLVVEKQYEATCLCGHVFRRHGKPRLQRECKTCRTRLEFKKNDLSISTRSI